MGRGFGYLPIPKHFSLCTVEAIEGSRSDIDGCGYTVAVWISFDFQAHLHLLIDYRNIYFFHPT